MIYFCDFWLLDGTVHRMFDVDSHPMSKWCPGMDGSHQTAIPYNYQYCIDPVGCCLRTSEVIILCLWPRRRATLRWCTASWRQTPPWTHWAIIAGTPGGSEGRRHKRRPREGTNCELHRVDVWCVFYWIGEMETLQKELRHIIFVQQKHCRCWHKISPDGEVGLVPPKTPT